jgi:hypothetical protein
MFHAFPAFQQSFPNQWNVNNNSKTTIDDEMASFSEDDMDTSTSNISGYVAVGSTTPVYSSQHILPAAHSVSTLNAQSFAMSAPQTFVATAMEEDIYPLESVNSHTVLPSPGYMLPSIGQVLSSGSCVTGQTPSNPSISGYTMISTPQIPPQFQIATTNDFAGSDIGTLGEQAANDSSIWASPSERLSRLKALRMRRKSAIALTRHGRSSPSWRTASSTSLPPDLEAFKHTLDADLARDYWTTELGRIPLTGISAPLRSVPGGSVLGSPISPHPSPEIPISIDQYPIQANSGQLSQLGPLSAGDFNVHAGRGAAQLMPTSSARMSNVSSGSFRALAEKPTPPVPDKSVELLGGVMLHGSALQTIQPTEFTYPTPGSTTGFVTNTTRPTRKENPSTMLSSSPSESLSEATALPLLSRTKISLSNHGGFHTQNFLITGSSKGSEVKPFTSLTTSSVDTTSVMQLSSKRASEPQKLLNTLEPKQVAALRKEKWETMSLPRTPFSKQVSGKEVNEVSVRLDSSASTPGKRQPHPAPTPRLSDDFLSPLDGLNPLPGPFALPKSVKRIPLSPAFTTQYSGLIPNVVATTPLTNDSGQASFHNVKLVPQKEPSVPRTSPTYSHESIGNSPPNVPGLSSPLKSGKLKSALDLAATWEMKGLTAPWYAQRTEQLTRDVNEGIEKCFYVTVELIQVWKCRVSKKSDSFQ